MRIVFFTNERSISNEVFLYMFANVAASFDDVHIVAVRSTIDDSFYGSFRGHSEKLRKLWRSRTNIVNKLEFVSSYPIKRSIGARNERKALAGIRALPRPPIMPQPERVVYVDTVNGPDAEKAISDLKPDVVIQADAGILRKQIFEIARIGTLNLHPGIAPLIKGMDSIYWALWKREPRWLGATVHFIDEGIDTGPVLAYVPVTPHFPGEPYSSLFVRVYESGVAQLVGTLSRLAQGERWTIHPPRGERVYRSAISGWRLGLVEIRDALLRVASSIKKPIPQVPDTMYNPPIENPAYARDSGPVVAIDEAHFNFHTMEGRYQPFAELLRRDGYIVRPLRSEFSRKNLEGVKILVVANALAERNHNERHQSLPTPSAFSDEEIRTVRGWVERGGSLLLIVDHMPWPGAADKLAAAFGIRMNNGFALREGAEDSRLLFGRSDGSLADHPISNGRITTERVDSVATFTGSAFQVDEDTNAQPLLILGSDIVSIMPTVAWQFTPETPRVPVGGWYQGAVLRLGEGRVAVFGEAAMFSAQLWGPKREPFGMNDPIAAENFQFVLNVAHWLSRLLDTGTDPWA